MPGPRVSGYTAMIEGGDPPSLVIQLYDGNRQVGSLMTTDPRLFMATIDMLRHEGPSISWDESRQTLFFGLEPVGEDET